MLHSSSILYSLFLFVKTCTRLSVASFFSNNLCVAFLVKFFYFILIGTISSTLQSPPELSSLFGHLSCCFTLFAAYIPNTRYKCILLFIPFACDSLLFSFFFCLQLSSVFFLVARNGGNINFGNSKDVFISWDAFEFFALPFIYSWDICVVIAHHPTFMRTISFAYRLFRPRIYRLQDREREQGKNEARVKTVHERSAKVFVSFRSLKYVSSLAPCLEHILLRFRQFILFNFILFRAPLFLSFLLFHTHFSFHFYLSPKYVCTCVYVFVLHFFTVFLHFDMLQLVRVCILSSMLLKCFAVVCMNVFFYIYSPSIRL